jgi:alpha-glucosidase (family GH31 glycosyl hydrolase)
MADFAEWLPHDAALADGTSALDAGHNRYPVQWAQLNHDLAVERAASDDIGLLVFMRSGWLGSQPLVQVMWAGDQQTDWSEGDGMPSVIPMGLGLGVTGFPYYGSDIGGYMSQFTTPTTKELWFRWCTLGALSPVMRTHHGRSARDNWSWERDLETIAHLRRWSKIHMQLVPYLAAMAVQASETGAPLMRPVAYEYPDAGDWAWTTRDEYLLGDRILVAPVVVEGATSRSVDLPAGRWYPLLGGAALEGGTHEIPVPVTEIPAFVAGGSILLLYKDTIDTVVPAAPPAVVSTDVDLREVVLFAGTGPYGSIREGAATYTWTGRDPALPAPSSAIFEGANVAVNVVDGERVVDVTGPGTLVFEGGGTLSIAGTTAAVRVHLRL